MERSPINRRSFLKQSGIVGMGLFLSGCVGNSDSELESTSIATTRTTSTTTSTTQTNEETSEDDINDFQTATTEEKPDLRHLHGITGQTTPPDIEGYHQRRFEWSAVDGEWWYEMQISKALGEYYKHRFGRSQNFDVYVTDAYGDTYIQSIADEFDRLGEEYELSKRQIVDLAVAFVQGLNYTEDEVTSGYDQYTSYPVETLIDRGGDCEDSAILLAAILRSMGYGVILLGLFDASPPHMALGVKGDSSIPGTYYEYEGERYYYVETTGEGWQIGEMPKLGGSTRAEMIEIQNHPTLVYAYETSVEKPTEVLVNYAIANYGKVTAQQPWFTVAFENQFNQVVAESSSILESISYEEEISGTIELEPPGDEKIRLTTTLRLNGQIHDTDMSEWRRPV